MLVYIHAHSQSTVLKRGIESVSLLPLNAAAASAAAAAAAAADAGSGTHPGRCREALQAALGRRRRDCMDFAIIPRVLISSVKGKGGVAIRSDVMCVRAVIARRAVRVGR